MFVLLVITALTIGLLYYYCGKRMRYWKDHGVEQGNPKLVFGHYWDICIGKLNATEIVQKIYEENPNTRYTGMYVFSTPVLMVKDPELIKEITVKEFDSFTNHPQLVPEETDPVWAKNLFSLTGSKWKKTRAQLSPSFTSSKMRILFETMMNCAENLTQHLLQRNQQLITTELRDLFSRYTNDVIAMTVFGVRVDSLSHPNNEFYQMGNEVANFSSFKKTAKFLIFHWIPAVKKIMKIQFITDEAVAYFGGIIEEAIKTREEKGITGRDILNLLLEARKNKEKYDDLDLTNRDITAHALIFFIGGFESVASFISFTTYELALNPDVQKKLRKEIQNTTEEYGGKVTYEAVLNMKYMEMVVSESLRKWPSFTALTRICNKAHTIEPTSSSEKPLHIKVGTELNIPMYSIHHDPKYFPDPERFDPERFNEENKRNIQPYTYFPFGLGQRNCIGSRFTLMEGKILLFHLLNRFEIVPVEKTEIPLNFSKNTVINLRPVGGFWIGFQKICK